VVWEVEEKTGKAFVWGNEYGRGKKRSGDGGFRGGSGGNYHPTFEVKTSTSKKRSEKEWNGQRVKKKKEGGGATIAGNFQTSGVSLEEIQRVDADAILNGTHEG